MKLLFQPAMLGWRRGWPILGETSWGPRFAVWAGARQGWARPRHPGAEPRPKQQTVMLCLIARKVRHELSPYLASRFRRLPPIPPTASPSSRVLGAFWEVRGDHQRCARGAEGGGGGRKGKRDPRRGRSATEGKHTRSFDSEGLGQTPQESSCCDSCVRKPSVNTQ